MSLKTIVQTIVQTMRGPFLILTPVCVFLGVSTVVANEIIVAMDLLILVLLGAMLAHISVNTFNEYFDFKSGLDFNTLKTQFSGGSGALVQHPEMAKVVFAVAVASLTATLFIGFYFVWRCGAGIIPIGLLGAGLIVTYTDWINRYPLICLIAPGLGFGVLMVVGTHFVLAEQYSTLSWLAATVPFFLINNLLLLNQYPDIKADAEVGRYHLPIARGTQVSNIVYGAFVLATITAIITCVLTEYFPLLSLVALLPMPFAFFSLKGAIIHGKAIGYFPQYLGANVIVAVVTPLLLSVSIFIG